MNSEQRILKEITALGKRLGALIHLYQTVELNERGCVRYKEAVNSVEDAIKHLKSASVNTNRAQS
jgi:hypothetical protein